MLPDGETMADPHSRAQSATGFIATAVSPTGSAPQLSTRGPRGGVDLVVSDLIREETERDLERKVPRPVALFRFLVTALSMSVVEHNRRGEVLP